MAWSCYRSARGDTTEGRHRHRRGQRHRQGGRARPARGRLHRRRWPAGAPRRSTGRWRRGGPARGRARWPCRPTSPTRTSVRALFDADERRHSGASTCCSTTPASARPACRSRSSTVEQWRAVVDANLTGAFLCTQQAFRLMKAQDPRGGRIINNGSISAHAPRPQLGALHRHASTRITGLTQVHVARRPQVRHRLRPDRHRQCRHRHGREDSPRACCRPTARPAAEPVIDVEHVVDAVLYMAGCRWTPTSSS